MVVSTQVRFIETPNAYNQAISSNWKAMHAVLLIDTFLICPLESLLYCQLGLGDFCPGTYWETHYEDLNVSAKFFIRCCSLAIRE